MDNSYLSVVDLNTAKKKRLLKPDATIIVNFATMWW